jgi:hypothetical protein
MVTPGQAEPQDLGEFPAHGPFRAYPGRTLKTGADDLLADEEQTRPSDLAKRNRSRMAMRITARGRDRQPRR